MTKATMVATAAAALLLTASAALAQIPYALEQEGDVHALFPQGRLDADLQQVDLRHINTWRLTLGEVATAEMLEVHLVNAVAPFILCGKLKPLMLRERNEAGHIVNVSAMEGSFSRGTKTDKHPHTNMAKAALNMIVRSAAIELSRSHPQSICVGLHPGTVDTGLSKPFQAHVPADRLFTPELAAQQLLNVIRGLTPAETGRCFAWDGTEILP